MSNAARKTDPTIHILGKLALGEPTVLICGLEAARKGDPHICPTHVGGVISGASSTVFITGAAAARKGDACDCGNVGIAGLCIPSVIGPPPPPPATTPPTGPGLKTEGVSTDGKFDADTDKTETARVMHGEADRSDTDQDGTFDTARFEGSAVRMRNQKYGNVGPVEFGARHNMDLFYGRGQGGFTTNYGIGGNGSLEFGAIKQGGEVMVGPANDNGKNPYMSLGGEYDLFHAEGKGDILLGDDGRRIGIGGMGKLGAEVLGGNVYSRQNISIPFTDWTIGTRTKVSGSAVTVGAGAGGWGFWDRQEGRLHLGFMGAFKALLGLEVDFDLSIGRRYQQDPPPEPPPTTPTTPPTTGPPAPCTPIIGFGSGGIPNMIAQGCPTVLIGG